MADYNGWPSYETWNVMLWLDNDEPAYRYYTGRMRRRKDRGFKRLSAGTAHAIAGAALGTETGDGVHLSNSRIRWGRIAEAMRESVEDDA